MTDARIIDQVTRQPINFTCENARFMTDRSQGHPHGPHTASGSVYPAAILGPPANQWSLWLEHIVEKQSRIQLFWLMWYDPTGKPMIPMSGVFSRADFEQMVGRLARLV